MSLVIEPSMYFWRIQNARDGTVLTPTIAVSTGNNVPQTVFSMLNANETASIVNALEDFADIADGLAALKEPDGETWQNLKKRLGR